MTNTGTNLVTNNIEGNNGEEEVKAEAQAKAEIEIATNKLKQ